MANSTKGSNQQRTRTGSSRRTGASEQAQSDRLAETLSTSAHQIWLAGIGALGRAQAEGTRLFERLVEEGDSLERSARTAAGTQADVMRDAISAGAGSARARATSSWERLEKGFEERVRRTMATLGVPGRDELTELSRRVDTLTAELRKRDRAAVAPGRVSKKAASKRASAVKAPGPAAAHKAVKTPAPRKGTVTATGTGTRKTASKTRTRP